MSFPWETRQGAISGVAEEAKKEECQPGVSFNPYRILHGKYLDPQLGNKDTKTQRGKGLRERKWPS